MSPDLLSALLTIALGAVAGGVTNTVAVWMLFHPYEPIRIGRWQVPFLHGAVPKNQPRLARAIGRTVGDRLLTPADLQAILSRPEFREAFDQRLERVLRHVFEVERGPVREILPSESAEQVESLLTELAETAADRFITYLDSEEFEDDFRGQVEGLVAAMAEEPMGSFITPDREDALTRAVDRWLWEMAESPAFRRVLDDYLERAARRILQPDRTFEEVLPEGLAGTVERTVGAYLPLVIHRLGRLLEDPVARSRFEAAIHDLLQRFLRDLRFHQRVVARFIVTEETVDRVLDAIEEEGAETLSEMLRDPGVQEAMAQGINDAVVDFLHRPVPSVLGDVDSDNVREVRAMVRTWVLEVARDPATRTFLVEKLRNTMERTAARTWGEFFEKVPPERVARWLVVAARSEAARGLYREGARRVLMGVLDRPVGRPDRWLPDGTRQRLQEEVADPIWGWLQAQVPEIVERLEVARRVEEKVLHFPTPEIENLVRRVTERELRLIIRLGFLLGAVVGTILVSLHALVA